MARWGWVILPLAVAACTPPSGQGSADPGRAVSYEGVSTRLLAEDLVNFHLVMGGDATREDIDAYGRCAAAQYALIRGFGFARHVRTTVYKEGGLWTGDAVYTISPALPQGLQTLDAEVVVAACAENGIPTV